MALVDDRNKPRLLFCKMSSSPPAPRPHSETSFMGARQDEEEEEEEIKREEEEASESERLISGDDGNQQESGETGDDDMTTACIHEYRIRSRAVS